MVKLALGCQMADDDFTVESLAAYLHLTPAQVQRMASRGNLPGRRVAGQWRFSQAEIHHWFERRIGLSDDQQLIEVQRVLRRQAAGVEDLPLTQLLSLACVAVPLGARTKNSVIQKMCHLAADAGRLWDPEKMIEAVKNREELHPTALDIGVALLHPRRPMDNLMEAPFLALGITTGGIPFGGPRGSLTDIFLLIGSCTERGHLRTLARLSRLITSAQLLSDLRTAGDAADAWKMIVDADAQLV